MSKKKPKPGRPFLLTRDSNGSRMCDLWYMDVSPIMREGHWYNCCGEASAPSARLLYPSEFVDLFGDEALPPPGSGPKRIRIVMIDDD